jgi:SAM-dependent methyltransferase
MFQNHKRHWRILHFAPEPGLFQMLRRQPNVDYVPGDLRPAHGHARVDATNIDLPGRFDGVITSHVLEHIPDDETAIAEMHRILAPDGWAIVLVPDVAHLEKTFEDHTVVTAWGRYRTYGQHDHVRIYGRDFVSKLRAPGFRVVDRYARELGDEAGRFGLGNDRVYFCRYSAHNVGAV